ncbi:uncharacterized protein LOC143377387 [Andrena cerasifolii]|uniref:uncharacterized protein LOC143377387 n=1 Tax=Andrena cerasifolii TaxID=2819439 RepID=UPI004037D117
MYVNFYSYNYPKNSKSCAIAFGKSRDNMKINSKLFVTTFLGLISCSVRSVYAAQKVIIDTDAGSDDAAAILLTLKSEFKGFKVIAITCTYGNAHLHNVVENVLKVLTVANRSDIPVYEGVDQPLIQKYVFSDCYFGSDGFGDFNFTDKITAKVDKSKHAAVALVDLVKKYPGEITLLSLGPLTNAAVAVSLYPSFFKRLKNHIILGSSVAGIGNSAPNVEFNFYQDPESNYIVLNHTKLSVLYPWETVLSSNISVDWRVNVLGKVNSTIVRFLNEAERISIPQSTTWKPSDAMAAAVMIWREFITRSIKTNVDAVYTGMARGSVLVDYTNLTGRLENTEIVQAFNVTAFKDVLLELFS